MEVKLKVLLAISGVPSLLAGWSAPACAQAGTVAEADEQEVIVTARRREESLQDAPVAVTVLTGEALARQQLVSTTDLDQVAPNLQFTSHGTLTGNNSAAQVFIRGIGQTDATPAVDPGVGIYIDDVYMGRSVGGAMEFRDIASIQVLRGPQGTLFGRNTIGGAVLITTNAPGTGAGNRFQVGIGDDNLFEVFAAYDIPISSHWSARVSGGFRDRDGYVRRIFDGKDLGDEHGYFGQGALRWQPDPSLNFLLRGDYAREDENGSPFVFRAINENAVFVAAQSVAAGCPGATFPPPFVPQTPTRDPRCGNDAQALGPFTNGGTFPASSRLENYGASFTAEWEASDAITLKSITAARHLQWSGTRDADNTPLLILHTDYSSESDQFSQELQALIEVGRLSGVVGGYYFEEDSFDRVIVPIGNPGTSYDTQRVSLDTEAWAAFTQWTFEVTDALSVTAGIRYTDEAKGIRGILFNVAPASAPEPAIPTALCPFNGPPPTQTGCLFLSTDRFEENFSATTGSASIQYRFGPAFMAYLSWSQGFKSGGFNQRYNAAPPDNAPIAFDSEQAETFELGFKTNPARRLRFNAAFFTTSYDDIQLTYRLGVVPLLFNAGAATIRGAEFELDWVPVADLRIDASLGWLDNEFDSIIDPPPFGPIAPTAIATLDSRLPFTPEWQAHIGASYTFRFGNGWALTPRVDVSHTSDQFFDAGNSPEIAQDDVTVVNAGLTLAQENWRVTLNVFNLTDELYPTAGTSSLTTASGYAEIIYARPRNFTLIAAIDF
ncbi:TonB-dependent receptor [Sphingosinicella sp. CPCC 101087]|uniref:TonB-dependent receptor n=1 Tax=Sphingosinicella sp. CPCC 101087 TaxID=2497754 RepID=UPI00101C3CD0|nr:TonB-dependent receptor [Sphingosinicella sp. CPCC 101087]